jgi:hypothetical protein
LVARLLLVTIMCSASSAAPSASADRHFTSALASLLRGTRYGRPSTTLMKRLRTCTREIGSKRCCSMASLHAE